MFKNLYQKSKKIVIGFTLITSLAFLQQNNLLFKDNELNIIENLKNKFPAKNKEDIIKEKNKEITKEHVIDLYKNFIEKVNKLNNNYVSIIMDSNKNTDHAENVKGIFNTITNSFDKYMKSLFLPIDSDNLNNNSNINYIDYIKIIANESKDKIVFINESFGDFINFNKDDVLTFDSINNYKSKIKLLKEVNNELITILNDNPNIVISKAEGNYGKILENKNELLKMFQEITNNNYKLTKELIPFLNLIIKSKIDEKALNTNLKDFLNDFQELCKIKNIDYNSFISLYIKDYLIHYDRIDLLEKSKLLNQNNHFGLQQLFIVEALDLNTIKDNLITYKKFNPNIDLKELEDDIKKLEISNILQYDLNDLSNLNKLYEKYKDKYKEIFSFTKYGSLSSLMYKDNEVLKTSFHGQNANKIESAMGTSFASPYFLAKYTNEFIEKSKDKINDLLIDYNNFKSNINFK